VTLLLKGEMNFEDAVLMLQRYIKLIVKQKKLIYYYFDTFNGTKYKYSLKSTIFRRTCYLNVTNINKGNSLCKQNIWLSVISWSADSIFPGQNIYWELAEYTALL
jgi:hypothetical protein